MEHQRLGDIPKTKKWTTVVLKVAGSGVGGGGASGGGGTLVDDVDTVAAEILDVAEKGLYTQALKQRCPSLAQAGGSLQFTPTDHQFIEVNNSRN